MRLNLREVALRYQGGAAKFLETTLPRYAELTAEIIEARIRYLVEEARFFDHHFLAMEGLLDLGRFSAMYGVFGMAEAVEDPPRAGRSRRIIWSRPAGERFGAPHHQTPRRNRG